MPVLPHVTNNDPLCGLALHSQETQEGLITVSGTHCKLTEHKLNMKYAMFGFQAGFLVFPEPRLAHR